MLPNKGLIPPLRNGVNARRWVIQEPLSHLRSRKRVGRIFDNLPNGAHKGILRGLNLRLVIVFGRGNLRFPLFGWAFIEAIEASGHGY